MPQPHGEYNAPGKANCMSYRVSMFFVTFALCCVATYGQTDIGSASSAGGVTSDHSLASMTPDRRLDLQEKQLSDQLKKFEAHTRQVSPNALGLSDTERQDILKAYDAFRKAGHEMSPFDFLATAIALQGVQSGNLSDKNATAVRAALEANGLKNSNITPFAAVLGGGGAQPSAKSVSEQYKESLSRAKDELHRALK
jgi:hypothetical protein